MKVIMLMINKNRLAISLILLSLFYSFSSLFFLHRSFAAVPPENVGNPATAETLLNKRRLLTFAECLQKDVIDESDDDGKISDFGDLFDNNEDERDVIVVGLDRESDNGVMTCSTVIRQGLEVLEPSAGNYEGWLMKSLTGKTLTENNGQPLSDDKIEANRSSLYSRVKAAADALPGPSSLSLRDRYARLVTICYTMEETAKSSLGADDFEAEGVGFFYLRDADDIQDEFKSFVTLNSGSFSATDAELGDLELDFSGQRGDPNDFNADSSDFYPLGRDVGAAAGYKYDAVVDCPFIKKNKSIALLGTKVENGKLVDAATGEELGQIGSGENSGTGEESCESEGGDLGWILCSLLGLIDNVISKMDETLNTLLRVPDPYLQDDGVEGAWRRLRNIAYILLIPIMLVMVIGTALGFEFISAYTVKKAMPRLIAAVLFITLSYPICAFLITLTNAVGGGIMGLITNSVAGASDITISSVFDPDGKNVGAGFLVGAAGGAAILAVGSIGILFSYALVAFVGILIGFIALAFRQFLLIALLLFAPVAIVAWIFPGNDKLWKLWWGTFSKLLLLYPLIMVLIASGRAFAAIVQEVSSQGGDAAFQGGVATFIKIVAYVGPYFFIPAVFKFAGGIFATVSGMANDRSRGLFDRQKKFRAKKMGENWQDTKDNKRFQGNNALTRRLGSGMQKATLLGQAGLDPRKMRGRLNSAQSTRISALSAKGADDDAVRSVTGNDDLLAASIHGNGTEADARAYLQGIGQRGRELDQNVAAITQARKAMGREAFQDFAAANNAGTGTGYRSGPAEMLEAINRVAGGDSARAARILNNARGMAEKARRVDLYGAGFATSADQLSQLRNGQTNAAAVNEVMTDEALNTKSAGEVATSRNGAVVNMAGAIERRLARAQLQVDAARSTGDAGLIATAEHVQKQAIAATSTFIDTAGSASPENARYIGGIMGQETGITTPDPANDVYEPVVDGQGNPVMDATTGKQKQFKVASGVKRLTVGEAIEHFESDSEYKQYKKTYTNERIAAQQAAAQQQQMPGGPGGPGIPGIPGGPGGP